MPPGDVTAAWVHALPLIRRVADQWPDMSLSGMWETLRSGRGELWLIGSLEKGTKAAIVTELRDWDGMTVAYVIGAGSDDSREWFTFRDEFAAQLKARGADSIVFQGRNGFERIWPGAKVLRKLYKVGL